MTRHTHRFAAAPATTLLLFALVLTACGDPVGPPAGGEPTDTFPPIPGSFAPDPAGVLLPGAPDGKAAGSIVDMPEAPADPAHRDGDAITSRLTAWVAPGVSVADVNDALQSVGARIVGMSAGIPLVTLVIPPAADEAAAVAIGEQLAATSAFLLVTPGRAAGPGRAPRILLGSPTPIPPDTRYVPQHLAISRSPAAWNLRDRAHALSTPVSVLVEDLFTALQPNAEIPSMRFPNGITGAVNDSTNHGWHVVGTIAARFGGTDAVGIHPSPDSLLDVLALPIGGLTWEGLAGQIRNQMPASGNFVVSTSLGFPTDSIHDTNGGNWTTEQLMSGFMNAVAWRESTLDFVDRYLHATAAGNERTYAGNMRDARLGSLWTIAHAYDDPRMIFPAGALSTEQRQRVDQVWNDMMSRRPAAAVRQRNIIVVGSSNSSGQESWFSNEGPTLRTIGEDVESVCGDPASCRGSIQELDGTSMATPQIAGMVAWMWNLRPDWAPLELRDRVLQAYQQSPVPGVTDHYILTLSADESLADAPVRRSLLDVAGDTGNPGSNGRFDELDIELFLTLFESFQTAAGGADDSRYDLNGNGLTANGIGDAFDLDVDLLPNFGPLSFDAGGTTVDLDESSVTDLEILCYYAYSSLYAGSHARRDELISGCTSHLGATPIEIAVLDWDDQVPLGTTNDLVLEVTADGQPVSGADVSLVISGGSASPASGTTDVNGEFATQVTMAAGSDSIEVRIDVSYEGRGASETVVAALLPPGIVQAGLMFVTVRAQSQAGAGIETDYDLPSPFSQWNVPTVDFDTTIVTSASAADSVGRQASASAVGGMNLTVVRVDTTVTSYAVNATGSAAASASPIVDPVSAAGWVNLSIVLNFTVTEGGVPFSLDLEYNPGDDESTLIEFQGPTPDAFELRTNPGTTYVKTLQGALPPGDYRFHVSTAIDAEAIRFTTPSETVATGFTFDLSFGGS